MDQIRLKAPNANSESSSANEVVGRQSSVIWHLTF
jgi:hypothetical protein